MNKKIIASVFAWVGVASAASAYVEAFDEQENNASQLTLRLRITNASSDTLNNVRARYFLNYDRSRVLNISQYYMEGATTSIDTLGDFLAVNIDIPKIAPGIFPNVSGISIGVNDTNYLNLNKPAHFSYPGTGDFAITSNIPLYVNGSVLVGSTPIGDEMPKIRFVGVQPENSDTRSAWVELENYGPTDIDLNDYFLKWTTVDSVSIGNVVLPSGNKIRICQSNDSLECPTADVVVVKNALPFGENGNLGVLKSGLLLQQIVWNDSNKILSENTLPSFSTSYIPYDVESVSLEGIFIQKAIGVFFTFINGCWVSHKAEDINRESRLPNPQPYAENLVVYDSSRLFRFAWHPVKNVARYIITVKNENDSIVYQERTNHTYVELDLDGDSYLWNVQSDDDASFSLEGSFWNRIRKILAEIDKSHLLGVPAFGVRKDTKMLALNWGEKITDENIPWDKPNDTGKMTEEESWRCWSVGIHMLNAHYKGNLTQDEIKFHGKTTAISDVWYSDNGRGYYISRAKKENIITPFGLVRDGGGKPYETKATLAWALNITDSEITAEFSPEVGVISVLSETIVKNFIDARRPILTSNGSHVMVIDGYDYHDPDNKKIHFLNIHNIGDDDWLPLNTWKYRYYYVPVTEKNAKRTDYRVHNDSDGDGIVDFDEVERFGTNPYNVDSDGDGIDDKTEIISYVKKEPFVNDDGLYIGNQSDWLYYIDDNHRYEQAEMHRLEQYADVDGDGKRAELDVDSDHAENNGVWDGDEITDGTDPFDPSDDTYQSSPTIVTTLWDAPADVTIYSFNTMRVNDRTICYDGDGYCKVASQSSRVNFAINVGVQSIVGDIYSRGGVWLRVLSEAKGNISIYSQPVNKLSVNIQDRAVFLGTENHLNFKDWPYSVNDGSEVAFSYAGNPENLIVADGFEASLNDGDEYQMVKVESGGTLKIGPGEMKIGMIQLESGSSIEFTNPGQGTIIWTNGKTLWKTSIVNENQELVARGFKLIQLSDKDMFIEGDWAGTIHAAKADLIMGQTKKLMYGRFVGKNVTFHQNTRVYRVDFDPIVSVLDVVLK
ncbi:hypothetical protein [uncultured Fibrobacter sp.]|uniref:hypothetical protein n=1 Tax=uncultured Fibrobacter sp. TaxID=261512 RepID=UPI0025D182DA|nr:hypothetical protein [uncultured Fibrobacter sp.]